MEGLEKQMLTQIVDKSKVDDIDNDGDVIDQGDLDKQEVLRNVNGLKAMYPIEGDGGDIEINKQTILSAIAMCAIENNIDHQSLADLIYGEGKIDVEANYNNLWHTPQNTEINLSQLTGIRAEDLNNLLHRGSIEDFPFLEDAGFKGYPVDLAALRLMEDSVRLGDDLPIASPTEVDSLDWNDFQDVFTSRIETVDDATEEFSIRLDEHVYLRARISPARGGTINLYVQTFLYDGETDLSNKPLVKSALEELMNEYGEGLIEGKMLKDKDEANDRLRNIVEKYRNDKIYKVTELRDDGVIGGSADGEVAREGDLNFGNTIEELKQLGLNIDDIKYDLTKLLVELYETQDKDWAINQLEIAKNNMSPEECDKIISVILLNENLNFTNEELDKRFFSYGPLNIDDFWRYLGEEKGNSFIDYLVNKYQDETYYYGNMLDDYHRISESGKKRYEFIIFSAYEKALESAETDFLNVFQSIAKEGKTITIEDINNYLLDNENRDDLMNKLAPEYIGDDNGYKYIKFDGVRSALGENVVDKYNIYCKLYSVLYNPKRGIFKEEG